jgi:hypothetical protein
MEILGNSLFPQLEEMTSQTAKFSSEMVHCHFSCDMLWKFLEQLFLEDGGTRVI